MKLKGRPTDGRHGGDHPVAAEQVLAPNAHVIRTRNISPTVQVVSCSTEPPSFEEKKEKKEKVASTSKKKKAGKYATKFSSRDPPRPSFFLITRMSRNER
jgi:hypothetical protein